MSAGTFNAAAYAAKYEAKGKPGRPRLQADATGRPVRWRMRWINGEGIENADAYADPDPVFRVLAAWARHGLTPDTLRVERREGTEWRPV